MSIDSHTILFAQRQARKRKIIKIIISLLLVVFLLQFLLQFLLRPLYISSTAMYPEFSKGSAVFIVPANSLFYDTEALPRGTLVQFDNLSVSTKNGFQVIVDFIFGLFTFQRFRPFETSTWGKSEVYRIIGVPGDTLYVENYITHIREGGSGHFLTEFELSKISYDVMTTNYPSNWDMNIGAQGQTEQITLKKGEYYLLSDNRVVALDSRVFGPVSADNITGKVFLQYFPFNAIRVLD